MQIMIKDLMPIGECAKVVLIEFIKNRALQQLNIVLGGKFTLFVAIREISIEIIGEEIATP